MPGSAVQVRSPLPFFLMKRLSLPELSPNLGHRLTARKVRHCNRTSALQDVAREATAAVRDGAGHRLHAAGTRCPWCKRPAAPFRVCARAACWCSATPTAPTALRGGKRRTAPTCGQASGPGGVSQARHTAAHAVRAPAAGQPWPAHHRLRPSRRRGARPLLL